MKKDGVYRYSLQWAENTAEKIRAGELLEQLGNRKSAVIIAALNDYMDAHPELCSEKGSIEVKVSGYDRRQIEEIIRSMMKEQSVMIAERTDEKMSTDHQTEDDVSDYNDMLEDDIARMLDNLDLFNEL